MKLTLQECQQKKERWEELDLREKMDEGKEERERTTGKIKLK